MTETDACGEPGLRRLELRIGVPEADGVSDYLPVVRMLIDGQDLLAGAASRPLPGPGSIYVGWPPAVILGNDAPLLPAEPPQRVVLYVDGCGVADCRCLAAIIRVSGDRVIWSDIRECWDGGPDYDQPFLEQHPAASEPADLPDLVFGTAQYIAEVQQVTAEREWESDRWKTALLLAEYLQPGHPWSIGEDFYPGWAEPASQRGDSFLVILWDENIDHGVTVRLTADPGSPEQRARSMADFLLATPTERWPVIRHMRQGRYFLPDDGPAAR